MVKVRMNTADVAAEVKCLRKLIGMRCSNIYDLSPKVYLFKLMKSSGVTESGESEKTLLLVESGVRLHTTEFVRDKSTTPSGFTLKLRKHIRTRRLEDVRQLGMDRVVEFQFGLGSSAHHIILELYAQGNLILTDSEYNVLTLLRTHRDDETGMTMMPHHCYPVDLCRTFERTSVEKLELILNNAARPEVFDTSEEKATETPSTSETILIDNDQKRNKLSKKGVVDKKVDEGNKGRKKSTLKSVLGETIGYGPALCEHIILDAGLQPNTKVGPIEDILHALATAITRFEDWLNNIRTGETIPEGFIIMKKGVPDERKDTSLNGGKLAEQVYDEFSPLLLHQFESRSSVQFVTFDQSMDEFFSKIESQRAEQQQKVQEDSAMQKLNKIRADQENRVQSLKREVDHSVKMAELIEYNLEDVDAAISAVRAALASGMDWKGLQRMVKEEKKAGNPVAALIQSLQLEKNCITLLLSNNLDDMEEDEKTQPVDKVEVDLALSAHANARRWFEMKKKQASKQEKTIAAHAKAFKAAEKKTQKQITQAKTVAAISHIRKVHWFEKFNWFISSENYLIISGRDAQQNELLVKRYMKKGDLYVHADLHGASSTLIKNHKPDQPIPPLTLNQAGCFTVCQSQAWDSKIVTSAWWVSAQQVSKTAPTGEYLTAGSFMIRGRKNFLPPHPLVMGFGILFRLDESSLGSHVNERRVRGDDDQDINTEVKSNEMSGASDIEVNIGLKSKGDVSNDDSSDDSLETDNDKRNSLLSIEQIEISSGTFSSEIDQNACSTDYKEASVKVETEVNQNLGELEELMDKALGLGSIRMSKNDSFNKYGLEIHNTVMEVEDRNDVDQPNKPSQRDKPYLSKAERRKQKKGTITVNSDTNLDQKQVAKDELTRNSESRIKVRDDKTEAKISRGRKGKLKKIKEKYADQDEEERELRMALLASAGTSTKGTDGAVKLGEGVASAKGSASVIGESTKICYKCKKPGHVAKDCSEFVEEFISSSVSTQQSSLATVGEGREDGDTLTNNEKLALQEQDINELGEEEKDKWTELDALTGNPLPADVLLYAVPVCGPYNALQSYKFRVKITPGTAKKGKAAKTAVNLFTHMQDATPREKELIKALNEPELVAAIIGNAKINAPGLTQLQQRQKKGKKNAFSDV